MPRLITFLAILCVSSLLFAGFYREVTALTQDLGRHILTGNIILETHQIPNINLFSYTYPNYPFINHHWLSEVIFALVFNQTSYPGLVVLSLALVFLTFGLFYASVYKKSAGVIIFLVSLLYLPILFERTDIRPELFSFFFLALFIFVLYRYRESYTKLIFFLPLVSFFWVNMHIYFPLGLLITGLFLMENVIISRKRLKQKHTIVLLLVFFVCLIATLLNPHVLSGAVYPLTVLNSYGYSIEENQTPFFLSSLGIQKTSFFYLKLSLVLLFVTLFLNLRKTKLIDWFLSISFSLIALLAVRNFPLFVLATFIPFVINLSLLYEKLLKNLKSSYASKIDLLTTVCLLVFFFFSLKSTIATEHTGFKVPQGAEKAVDFFRDNNLKGPIFNNFDIGSYLEYRLYPQEKVFVDGRPEAYPVSFFQDIYIPMQQNPEVFTKQEEKYNFSTIIFSHTDMTPWAQNFLREITQNSSWKPVYLDPMMIILLKDKEENATAIQRFGKDFLSLSASNVNSQNTNDLLHLSQFYALINFPEKERELLQKVVNLDSTNCYALQRVIQLNSQSSSHLTQFYQQKYSTSCL